MELKYSSVVETALLILVCFTDLHSGSQASTSAFNNKHAMNRGHLGETVGKRNIKIIHFCMP